MLYLERFNLEPTGRIVLWGSSEIRTIVWYTYEAIPDISFSDNPMIHDGKVIKFDEHPNKEAILAENKKRIEEMFTTQVKK